MGSAKLKEDLTNCVINFDRRILITDLLDEYKMRYEEVQNIVVDYLTAHENKQKFEKRFIIHGTQEGEHGKEVYKIVEERKLKEWLNKLKNAESCLYSVEVSGGAKAAASIFKPMSIEEGVNLRIRKTVGAGNSNGNTDKSVRTVPTEKVDIKQEDKKSYSDNNDKSKVPAQNSIKIETSPKKKSSKTTSPTEKKKSKMGSINNFFAPAAATKKFETTKDSKPVVKLSTTKKMDDFFKNQTEQPKTSIEPIKKETANTSFQLFDDNEEEESDIQSSDEEEKIEALKRDIISSDVEMEEDERSDSKSIISKRRRILDSDEEEEDPPLKQEKIETKNEEDDKELLDETYLDENGFVITKKAKQRSSVSKKSPVAAKMPAVTVIPPKDNKKTTSTSNKVTKANPAAKTKQAGIMNFFSKK